MKKNHNIKPICLLITSLGYSTHAQAILPISTNSPITRPHVKAINIATKVENLDINGKQVINLRPGGEIINSIITSPEGRLNIGPSAKADHIQVHNGIMNIHGSGEADHTKITGQGMVEVFQDAHITNTIIDSQHDDGRWSLRLFQGGHAENTLLQQGTMIIENGSATNTIADGENSQLKFHGGQMDQVVLKNGAKLAINITSQYQYGEVNQLEIQSGGKAIASTSEGGQLLLNNTHIQENGTLIAQSNTQLNNTQVDQNGKLILDSNSVQLLGKTTILGTLKSSKNNQKIHNQGALIFQQNGNQIIDSNIEGNGSLTIYNQGKVVLNGQNSYTGNTLIGDGNTDIKSGLEVNGQLQSHTTIAQNGVLGGTGQVNDVLNQGGTIQIGSLFAGDIPCESKFASLTINGNYTAQANSQLILRANLDPYQPSSDQLIINGGTVTGQTSVTIHNEGGLGGLTQGNGIEIIKGTNGAKLGTDSFTLAKPVRVGAYEYVLHHANTDTNNESWFLSSQNANNQILYRPEVSLYSTALEVANQMALNSVSTYNKRMGTHTTQSPRTWGRLIGQSLHNASNQAGLSSYHGHVWGFQIGTDLYQNQLDKFTQKIGVYTSSQTADLQVEGETSHGRIDVGDNQQKSTSLGLYWHVQQAQTGWYSDAIAQWTSYRGHLDSRELSQNESLHGQGWLASLEVGQTFSIYPNVHLQPQAQIIYQTTQINDSQIANANIQFKRNHSCHTRLGSTLLWMRPTNWQPYLSLNYWHQKDKQQLNFNTEINQTTITPDFDKNHLELGLGLSGHLTPAIKLYSQMSYQQSLMHSSRQNWQCSLGGMYSF